MRLHEIKHDGFHRSTMEARIVADESAGLHADVITVNSRKARCRRGCGEPCSFLKNKKLEQPESNRVAQGRQNDRNR